MKILKAVSALTLSVSLLLPLSGAFAQDLEDRNGDGEIRIVAVGDSITRGVGDGVSSGAIVEEAPLIPGTIGYPGRVENFLGVFVDNRGVPGELLTEGVETRFANVLRTSSADYVIILEGSNDAIFRINSGVYRAILQKLINIATVMGVEPILSTLPLTYSDRESLVPFLRSYSREVRELAAVNLLTVSDVEVAFDQNCPGTTCPFMSTPEGLHPNTEGYDLIARVITESITGEPIELPEEETEEEEGETDAP